MARPMLRELRTLMANWQRRADKHAEAARTSAYRSDYELGRMNAYEAAIDDLRGLINDAAARATKEGR